MELTSETTKMQPGIETAVLGDIRGNARGNMLLDKENSKGVGFKATDTIQVTDKMVRQFAEMSGDFNPIHLDDEYAATTRFKRRIAHGMILGALVSRFLNEKIGSGGIYLAQTLKFTNPVYIGDEIVFELEITKLHKTRGLGTVETIAKKTTGEIVMKGEATIMMSWGIKDA